MCDNRPMETINFTHHFLIAMPSLQDANFSGTLTYICRHDEQGAMGLIINRPMDMNLKNLFGQIALTASNEDVSTQPVYLGGPVQTDRLKQVRDPSWARITPRPSSRPDDRTVRIHRESALPSRTFTPTSNHGGSPRESSCVRGAVK